MKKLMQFILTGLAAGAALAPAAYAHGNIACDVPRKERQPQIKLQKDLKAAGWNIKKMQVYNGCYEVYGYDADGKSVEAFFDPRTLNRLKAQ